MFYKNAYRSALGSLVLARTYQDDDDDDGAGPREHYILNTHTHAITGYLYSLFVVILIY